MHQAAETVLIEPRVVDVQASGLLRPPARRKLPPDSPDQDGGAGQPLVLCDLVVLVFEQEVGEEGAGVAVAVWLLANRHGQR